jgi:hypothetical protein
VTGSITTQLAAEMMSTLSHVAVLTQTAAVNKYTQSNMNKKTKWLVIRFHLVRNAIRVDEGQLPPILEATRLRDSRRVFDTYRTLS